MPKSLIGNFGDTPCILPLVTVENRHKSIFATRKYPDK